MTQYSSMQNCNLLHRVLLGGAVVAMFATAGCVSSPPPPPMGADLNSVEMSAVRGDPYARRALTPMQQRRVATYQASHPEITPTWTRDAGNLAMGAGAGFLAGRSWSDARAAKTIGGTAEAAGAAEGVAAAEGTAAVRPAGLVGEGAATAAGEGAAITEDAAALGGRAAVTEGAAALGGRAAVTEGAAALAERFTVGEIVAGVACFAIIHFCP
jgi:hypothetical protein